MTMGTTFLNGRSMMYVDELPHRCTGISTHKGVLVLWDEDKDDRVIGFLDGMTDAERNNLAAIHECEGMVNLYWRHYIPSRFAVGQVMIPCDVWTAEHYVGENYIGQMDGMLELGTGVYTEAKAEMPTCYLLCVVA
jgi:hypothetical protein